MIMSSKKYTEEQQAAARAKWVAALRSEEFRQATGGLRRVPDKGAVGYCCLGVACEVAVREGAVPTYDGDCLVLPDEVAEWLGLADCAGTVTEAIGSNRDDEDGFKAHSLWELNDVAKLSFEDIADVIEAGKVALA